jgi:hypothetical protein
MSTEQSLQRLAQTLGKPASEFQALGGLKSSQIDLLTESILSTQQRQRAALEVAMNDSLSHVPALLRGPVKKILGIR